MGKDAGGRVDGENASHLPVFGLQKSESISDVKSTESQESGRSKPDAKLDPLHKETSALQGAHMFH